MSRFKKGDKVKLKSNKPGSYYKINEEYTITDIFDSGYADCSKGAGCGVFGDENIITNKITMNLKEKFANMFLREPEKSFRKAGITGTAGALTTDGQDVFLTWLLQKFGEEFKEQVVDKLPEDKE